MTSEPVEPWFSPTGSRDALHVVRALGTLQKGLSLVQGMYLRLVLWLEIQGEHSRHQM